jgi:hypothetical protein
MSTDSKMNSSHVEEPVVEEQDLKLQVTKSKVATTGTVQLTAGKVVYIPDPTADPRGEYSAIARRNYNHDVIHANPLGCIDPLNLPIWQKILILICLSLCK